MMKRVHLTGLILWVFTGLFCPLAGKAQITGPSTGFAGTPVTFTAAKNGTSFTWVMDTVDLRYNATTFPVAGFVNIMPNAAANWGSGLGSDMLFDNGSYYTFIPDPKTNKLKRLFFGANPTTVPVMTEIPLGTFGIPVPGAGTEMAIKIVKDPDNNRWYGILMDETRRMLQLDFGTSLTNTPTGQLNTYTGSQITGLRPGEISVLKYNGSWVAFAGYHQMTQPSQAKLVRFVFPSGLFSTPTLTSLIYADNALYNNIMGHCVYQEAGEWFMLGMSMGGSNNMVRFKFGTDLLNNSPVVENLGTFTNAFSRNPRSVSILADCNQLLAFAQKGYDGSNVSAYDFAGSISNTPQQVFLQTTAPGNGSMTLRPFMWNDTLNYLMSNTDGGLFRLRAFKYPAGTVQKYYDQTLTHTFTVPGTYYVTLHLDQGLNSGASAYCHTITISPSASGPAQPVLYTTAPAKVCQGTTNVTYTVPAVSGATSYTWSYTGAGVSFPGTATTTVPTINVDFATNATSGMLQVRAVNASGSSSSRDTAITVNLQPSLTISPNIAAVCLGDNITLTAGGAATYSWSPSGGNNAAATVSPAALTVYTVTGTSALGCTATTTREVTVNPLPVVTISPATAAVCLGDNITLTAGGAASYSWSPSGGSNASARMAPSATATYTVTGTSALNCKATATRQVAVNPLPVTQITISGSAVVCTGDSVVLNASGSGYRFDWMEQSSGIMGNGPAYAAKVTGTYIAVATDLTTNCTDSSLPEYIRVYPVPVVSLDQDDTSFCRGGKVRLSVSTQDTGLTYAWKNGTVAIPFATTYFVEVSESGTYHVVVGRSNAASCEDSTNVVAVTVHELPVVDFSWDGALVYAAPGFVSYQWYLNEQALPGAHDSTFRPVTDGGYKVAVTDSNGCMNTSVVRQLTHVGLYDMLYREGQVRVYPNPSGGIVRVDAQAGVRISVFSAEGKLLMSVPHTGQVDITPYPDGLYFLNISDKSGMLLHREKLLKNTLR